MLRVRSLYAYAIFPDVRGEWNRWARQTLIPLLESWCPDVVIASHEPASTLRLGLTAARLGYPLVADMGDPVLAPYTPARWRRRARLLEAEVCRTARLVVVTAPGTRDLLISRHDIPPDRVAIITQGHPAHGLNFMAPVQPVDVARDLTIELLYSGSFYRFRSVGNLLAAVLGTPGVRLNVATSNAPPELVAAAQDHPRSVRLLGFLNHDETLSAQICADVLVNISNEDSCQVPGKLYEYLGAGRPILHITSQSESDPAVPLMTETGAGFVTRGDQASLQSALAQIAERGSSVCGAFPDRDVAAVGKHEWASLARRYAEKIENVLN